MIGSTTSKSFSRLSHTAAEASRFFTYSPHYWHEESLVLELMLHWGLASICKWMGPKYGPFRPNFSRFFVTRKIFGLKFYGLNQLFSRIGKSLKYQQILIFERQMALEFKLIGFRLIYVPVIYWKGFSILFVNVYHFIFYDVFWSLVIIQNDLLGRQASHGFWYVYATFFTLNSTPVVPSAP